MAKILLIEDMKGVRDSLGFILSAAGHTVDSAEDGQEGLEKIKSGTGYDLVITDILMPKVDGTEVIIQSKKHHPAMPILAISAGGNGISATQALAIAEQKADGILEKPFSRNELLGKIKDLTAA